MAFEKDNIVDLSKSQKNIFNLTHGTLRRYKPSGRVSDVISESLAGGI